jgi:hypothetical protein
MLKCFIAAYGMSRHLLFSSTQGLDTTMAKKIHISGNSLGNNIFQLIYAQEN